MPTKDFQFNPTDTSDTGAATPTGFSSFLGKVFGPSNFEEEAFKKLGSGGQIGSQVGVARGTTPGKVDPVLQGRTNEELADLDRVQFNRRNTQQNPLAGIVGALALTAGDGVKSIPGSGKAIGGIMRALGAEDEAAKEFEVSNEHTSKPSLRQAMSNLRGAGMGIEDIIRTLSGS